MMAAITPKTSTPPTRYEGPPDQGEERVGQLRTSLTFVERSERRSQGLRLT